MKINCRDVFGPTRYLPVQMGRGLVQQGVVLSDELAADRLGRGGCLHDHFLSHSLALTLLSSNFIYLLFILRKRRRLFLRR